MTKRLKGSHHKLHSKRPNAEELTNYYQSVTNEIERLKPAQLDSPTLYGWLGRLIKTLIAASIFLWIATWLTGCIASGPVEIRVVKQHPPSHLLKPCEVPAKRTKATIADLIEDLGLAMKYLAQCNADKQALRELSDNQAK